MKINVGLNKKVGQANYGSLAANCAIEFEADQSLLGNEENLRRQVQRAYAACAQAVNDELARQQSQPAANGNGNDANGQTRNQASSNGNGSSGNGHSNGNGNGKTGRTCSEKQATYIRQFAGQIKGLGVRRLDALAQKMFDKPVAGLTSLDASGLIDTMKGIKAGEIDLDSVLGGAAS